MSGRAHDEKAAATGGEEDRSGKFAIGESTSSIAGLTPSGVFSAGVRQNVESGLAPAGKARAGTSQDEEVIALDEDLLAQLAAPSSLPPPVPPGALPRQALPTTFSTTILPPTSLAGIAAAPARRSALPWVAVLAAGAAGALATLAVMLLVFPRGVAPAEPAPRVNTAQAPREDVPAMRRAAAPSPRPRAVQATSAAPAPALAVPAPEGATERPRAVASRAVTATAPHAKRSAVGPPVSSGPASPTGAPAVSTPRGGERAPELEVRQESAGARGAAAPVATPSQAVAAANVQVAETPAGDEQQTAEEEHAAEPLPEIPNREDVLRIFEELRAPMVLCAEGQSGLFHVEATVTASGRVARALLEGDFQGTPVGSCIARAVRGATFPPFSRARFTVRYPVSL